MSSYFTINGGPSVDPQHFTAWPPPITTVALLEPLLLREVMMKKNELVRWLSKPSYRTILRRGLKNSSSRSKELFPDIFWLVR